MQYSYDLGYTMNDENLYEFICFSLRHGYGKVLRNNRHTPKNPGFQLSRPPKSNIFVGYIMGMIYQSAMLLYFMSLNQHPIT